jgi:hypothetical protein
MDLDRTQEERFEAGGFATAEEAIAECKKIVDAFLNKAIKERPDLTANELYEEYKFGGLDPFIVGDEAPEFSAWDYAKERSQVLAKRT